MAGGAESPDSDLTIAPVVGAGDTRRFTDSGIEVAAAYEAPQQPPLAEAPGDFPYTRGIHAEMYRERLWTMRQYAGYASAEESNARYRYLLAQGSTGLSMAFDLPTQLGLDSDDPRSVGEVGRTGVAIDTLDDMRTAFAAIPLEAVSVSMTINAPAGVLLCLYELVAEEQGVAPEALRGTSQNDILKEYIARGNYIYPPAPSMRLTTDLFAYCAERLPQWNTISISGYHYREKGASAVQEVAFTLASGIAYVDAAIATGLEVDDFAPRLAFFFNAHNNVFQEVAKFRAARRMWAQIMRERFGARDPRSLMLRFHTQTGGVTLTAQQPHNNIVRVALQAFAAVCGGTQSLHTNGYDEALALPSEHAAKLALRTQQVIACESGAADTADPFAGSFFIESLTDEIERRAATLIARVDSLGGALAAIDFISSEIDESAWSYQQRYATGQDIVVGVNGYLDEEDEEGFGAILRVDPLSERHQLERLAAFKRDRDSERLATRLAELRDTATGDRNLLPAIREALRARATLGEVCGALREVFGSHRPG
jgi:methylmalonyl-CoA mutase N-terminal domain/subunit